MNIERGLVRARRDFVTNEVYAELLAVFEETILKETKALTADAMQHDLAQINARAGSVEGMKKLVLLMGQYREQALSEFRVEPAVDPENMP